MGATAVKAPQKGTSIKLFEGTVDTFRPLVLNLARHNQIYWPADAVSEVTNQISQCGVFSLEPGYRAGQSYTAIKKTYAKTRKNEKEEKKKKRKEEKYSL